MENYEEKYKQALENFKKIKSANSDNKELVNFIEYEYPELRESEDERIRKEIIEFVDINTLSIDERHDRWISWLEKQGENNSWSEEDENGLGDALWAIQQARTIAKDENDMGNLWYAEHWLKSIKPNHWKPSEEQISSLGRFIEGVYGCVDFMNIKSLYNDIKNL